MPPKSLPAVPPHPAMRQSLRFFAMAAVLALSGAGSITSFGGLGMAALFFTMSGALLWLGLFVRKSAPAVQTVNLALNLLLTGRIAEAEERLAQADTRSSLGYIRRVIAVNRSWIALRRGDLERAVALAGEAITRPVSWISPQNEQANIVEARGLRAVARASRGDEAGAQVDIAAIDASPLSSPAALARGALARALLLEQAGDRVALGAHLAKNRRLLFEHTHPRERAIVRAYPSSRSPRRRSAAAISASRRPCASEASPRPTRSRQ
jgi:hypothetical protein